MLRQRRSSLVTRTLFGDETNSIFVLQTALSFLFALFCFVVVVVVVFFFLFLLSFLDSPQKHKLCGSDLLAMRGST